MTYFVRPYKIFLKNLLNKAHDKGIKNKMTFGISKFASPVIKY